MKTKMITSHKRRELFEAAKCISIFMLFAAIMVLAAGIVNISIFRFSILLLTGWMAWTFTEYFLHRFWMHNHFRNVNSKIYDIHMHHHKHPEEIKVNGLHRSILFIGGVVIGFFAVIWNNYFTLFFGFYNGVMLYSLLHIMLHKPWGRYFFPNVQKAHIHHHGKHPDKGFSFSTIFWDWLFGTLPPKEDVISDKMLEFYFKSDHHNDMQNAKKWMM